MTLSFVICKSSGKRLFQSAFPGSLGKGIKELLGAGVHGDGVGGFQILNGDVGKGAVDALEVIEVVIDRLNDGIGLAVAHIGAGIQNHARRNGLNILVDEGVGAGGDHGGVGAVEVVEVIAALIGQGEHRQLHGGRSVNNVGCGNLNNVAVGVELAVAHQVDGVAHGHIIHVAAPALDGLSGSAVEVNNGRTEQLHEGVLGVEVDLQGVLLCNEILEAGDAGGVLDEELLAGFAVEDAQRAEVAELRLEGGAAIGSELQQGGVGNAHVNIAGGNEGDVRSLAADLIGDHGAGKVSADDLRNTLAVGRPCAADRAADDGRVDAGNFAIIGGIVLGALIAAGCQRKGHHKREDEGKHFFHRFSSKFDFVCRLFTHQFLQGSIYFVVDLDMVNCFDSHGFRDDRGSLGAVLLVLDDLEDHNSSNQRNADDIRHAARQQQAEAARAKHQAGNDVHPPEQPALERAAQADRADRCSDHALNGFKGEFRKNSEHTRLKHEYERKNEGDDADLAGLPADAVGIALRDTGGRIGRNGDGRRNGGQRGEVHHEQVCGHHADAKVDQGRNRQRHRERIRCGNGHTHAEDGAQQRGEEECGKDVAAAEADDQAGDLAAKASRHQAADDHARNSAGQRHDNGGQRAVTQRLEDLFGTHAGLFSEPADDHHRDDAGHGRHGSGIAHEDHDDQEDQGNHEREALLQRCANGRQVLLAQAGQVVILGTEVDHERQRDIVENTGNRRRDSDITVRDACHLDHQERRRTHDRRKNAAAGRSNGADGGRELAVIADLLHHRDGERTGSGNVRRGAAVDHAEQAGRNNRNLTGAAGILACDRHRELVEKVARAGNGEERAEQAEQEHIGGRAGDGGSENAVGREHALVNDVDQLDISVIQSAGQIVAENRVQQKNDGDQRKNHAHGAAGAVDDQDHEQHRNDHGDRRQRIDLRPAGGILGYMERIVDAGGRNQRGDHAVHNGKLLAVGAHTRGVVQVAQHQNERKVDAVVQQRLDGTERCLPQLIDRHDNRDNADELILETAFFKASLLTAIPETF